MMILVLRLMCGGFWMISYSIAIYKGIKEKSYAMPFFSLCLNISWEMLYFKKVINGGDGGLIWIIIDSIWLILDAGILITYFLYGKKYYPDKLKKYLNEEDEIIVLGNQPYYYMYLNKYPKFKYFFQKKEGFYEITENITNKQEIHFDYF